MERSGLNCGSKLSFVSKMDLNVHIQLMFLCVVNIIFTFSGIILNTLVIASVWKSSLLRKKLCHFMIMVLSCFDLVAVVTIYPGILLFLIAWLREDYDLLRKMNIYLNISPIFLVFSLFVLLVMNIERYLGAYYPIFHHTSVTRRKLITFLTILSMPSAVVHIISRYVVKYPISFISFMIFAPPFIFVNFKLFAIARKLHRQRAVSPGKRTTANLKNVTTGLWAVVCFMLLFIPYSFNIAFGLAEKSKNTMQLSYIWTFTCITINCTLNSLIFFWKNKILRTEGIKILKTLKDRLVGF